jgi:uncharacterized paraquat-inducible protein A
MAEVELSRAAAVAGPTLILLVFSLFGISYVVSTVFGFPISLNLPFVVRVVGGALVIVGLAIAAWTFR